ncbi:MAG TPA: chemotaxis protein CheW [Gemmatimonadaceae bacterium]|nr:chemotaxis protein CheW [Gemmatimonadaceae bacterium]
MTSAAARPALPETDSPSELRNPREPAAETYANVKVLVFTLAGRRHCAGLGSVREVIPVQPATPLPGSPRQVRGLINLRGSIVTVLDAAMSEYGVPADDATASILLVERGTRVAGVVVDEVHDIGVLDRDVSIDALIDLGAMVQIALA